MVAEESFYRALDEPVSEMLTAELHAVIRHGLPIELTTRMESLLRLRGVQGRAVDPKDRASCVKALDGLLRLQLAQFENSELADAASILFGLALNTAGTTLTHRRKLAAAASRYELHHFRKRVEPRIVKQLAGQLRRDSEDFVRNRAIAPALLPTRRKPVLVPDVFAWEAVEHEEAISRLWAGIYALRSELLALERLVSMGGPEGDIADVAATALWRAALLLATGEKYRLAYGDQILHAETELSPNDLILLAGWTPPLSNIEELTVRECAVTSEDRIGFFARLRDSPQGLEISKRWEQVLSGQVNG